MVLCKACQRCGLWKHCWQEQLLHLHAFKLKCAHRLTRHQHKLPSPQTWW